MVIIVVCRLVEEVREACDVDITNDDVFMNARYFLFVRSYLYMYVLLCMLSDDILLVDLKTLSKWWSPIVVVVAAWILNMMQ